MEPTDTLNQRVRIEVSDPWDFGTQCGTAPLKGILHSMSDIRAVVALDEAVVYQGLSLQVTSRHNTHSVDLTYHGSTATNLVFVPATADSLESSSPEVFRKGVAAIGTIALE